MNFRLLSPFITLFIDGVLRFRIRSLSLGNGISKIVFMNTVPRIHSRSPFDMHRSKNQVKPVAPEQRPIKHIPYLIINILSRYSFSPRSHPRYRTPRIITRRTVTITLGAKRPPSDVTHSSKTLGCKNTQTVKIDYNKKKKKCKKVQMQRCIQDAKMCKLFKTYQLQY